jgi:hypothetical protein
MGHGKDPHDHSAVLLPQMSRTQWRNQRCAGSASMRGYATARIMECCFIAVGILALLAVGTLRANADGMDSAALVAVGQASSRCMTGPSGSDRVSWSASAMA